MNSIYSCSNNNSKGSNKKLDMTGTIWGGGEVHTLISNGGTIGELTDDSITALFKNKSQTSKMHLAPAVACYYLSTGHKKLVRTSLLNLYPP